MAKITEKEDKYLKKLVEESYAEQKIQYGIDNKIEGVSLWIYLTKNKKPTMKDKLLAIYTPTMSFDEVEFYESLDYEVRDYLESLIFYKYKRIIKKVNNIHLKYC